MELLDDLKVLWCANFRTIRGESHQARLASFYDPQAALYDPFRKNFLHGRREMMERLPLRDGEVWVDLGCGTGSNLEHVREKVPRLKRVVLVDLTDSLLDVARQRVAKHGWSNVDIIQADVTQWAPSQAVDAVTFSYSLTMIPDWFLALSNAKKYLKPGGSIGVADFYVARKHPDAGHTKHRGMTKSFWKWFFARDNVFLNVDHLPFLERHFRTDYLLEEQKRIPYILWPKVPYYVFVGTNALD